MSRARAAAALAALLVSTAQAEAPGRGGATYGDVKFVPKESPRKESGQRWALELKLGPYLPAIDTEPGLGTVPPTGEKPYDAIFDSHHRTMTSLELDWQYFHGFGSLAVGQTIGWWQAYGKGRLEDGSPALDATDLDILPNVTWLVIYRWDWLSEKYRWFPLVPYIKAGIAWYLWWVTNDSGAPNPSGVTYGYALTAGMMLRLDPFDRSLDRELDSTLGINSVAVNFELSTARVDDFGSDSSWILSDDFWQLGLMLEF